MPIRATSVAHGPACFDALARAVLAAKSGRPLTPVAVVVATNTAGVMARRALGRRGGAAAIDVLTLYRLAELLAAPALVAEGRKPVSTPVVDLAVKQVLTSSPGLYRDVADHPSTIVALRDLYREVRLAGRPASTALGRTGRGGEPSRVVAEVARRLATGWYDEGDLLEGAAQRARAALPVRFGRVVVHLPEGMRPLELDLLRALGDNGDVELIVGITGDEHADQSVVEMVHGLTGLSVEPVVSRPPGSSAGSLHVVSTTDADDEVRLAVQGLLDAARSGISFDRMTLLWPADRPYARLVEHHLAAAGLPWNGRPGTTVSERAVPRVLTELLELDRRGLRRTNLMTLLGDVPARDAQGRSVPTARWERIGRHAGVVRDADWDTHLPAWIDEIGGRRPGDVAPAMALLSFVTDLRRTLGPADQSRPWTYWVEWSHARLEQWFGPHGLELLTGDERAAWEQTQRVLDRLGHLDSLGGPVVRSEFRATFAAELDVAPARRGTVGDGIHVGSLVGARGLDVDLVAVVGAADGLLPPAPSVDPLLGDDDRSRAGLVTSDERVRAAHRRFLAVATTTPHVVATIPRGDLRATAAHQPSRWITTLVADTGSEVRMVDSHAHSLAITEFPISPSEHRLRELWTQVRSGSDVRDHPLTQADAVLARALALRDGRASDELTEYDGDLSARQLPRFDAAISPTQLERWARCPHAYFVRHVLGVHPVDEPDDIVSITALDRGSAIHTAIDRLQRSVLDGALAPPGPDGWTEVHAARLDEIAEQVADELEGAGRTGRVAYWATEREVLRAELQEWMVHDAAQWQGRTLRASEQDFGHAERVELKLPDGRPIRFKGQIDRVDELPDSTLVVTDHKTGRTDSYRHLTHDVTGGGTHFQLPVYAAAARVLHGRADTRVRAEYSFFRRGKFQRIGTTFDHAVEVDVAHALAEVVGGIEAGYFPATPKEPGWQMFVDCPYCEPDGLGTAERWPEWDRKRHDHRLARWCANANADASADADADTVGGPAR